MSFTIDSFDISRAIIQDKPTFKPFYPKEYQSLHLALKQGDVDPEQHLLIADIGSHIMALDLRQMSYHHVAQGELAGKPWLVAF